MGVFRPTHNVRDNSVQILGLGLAAHAAQHVAARRGSGALSTLGAEGRGLVNRGGKKSRKAVTRITRGSAGETADARRNRIKRRVGGGGHFFLYVYSEVHV